MVQKSSDFVYLEFCVKQLFFYNSQKSRNFFIDFSRWNNWFVHVQTRTVLITYRIMCIIRTVLVGTRTDLMFHILTVAIFYCSCRVELTRNHDLKCVKHLLYAVLFHCCQKDISRVLFFFFLFCFEYSCRKKGLYYVHEIIVTLALLRCFLVSTIKQPPCILNIKHPFHALNVEITILLHYIGLFIANIDF